MEIVFNPTAIQLIGATIILTVVIQVITMLTVSFRRLSAENEYQRLTLEALQTRLDTALVAHRYERDTAEKGWNGYRKFQVHRKVQEAEGVHSFYLTPHDGKPLAPFYPGQYLTFGLKIPSEQKSVVRCYSLSESARQEKYYRITVKKIPPLPDLPDGRPGLSSSFFNDVVKEGEIVDVQAPSGQFYLPSDQEKPVVLIGGGIGITPVLSMLNTLCDSGYSKEVWFFLGVQNSSEHVMKDHLEQLSNKFSNLHLHVCYSRPLEGDILGKDYQTEGFVSVKLFKELLPSNNYDYFICGPPPMMNSLTADLYEWRVPKENVRFEAFGKATVANAVKNDPNKRASDKVTSEITFVKTGKTIEWTSASGAILDLAEANGIHLDCACRSGSCGTCILAIKEGSVEHLIEPGFLVEEGSCLTCISTPVGNLVLDA